MRLAELVQSKRNELLAIAARYGTYNAPIFGAVAREQSQPESDVDFLVDMEDRRNLLDLSGCG